MYKRILIMVISLLILTGCRGLTGPKVSDADIATKVAWLKMTQNPGQTGQGNGVMAATIQTSAPQLTATITVTPTTQTSDPISYLGAPTWHDTFNGTNNFYTTSDENILFSYSADAFNMTAYNPAGWHSWSLDGRRIANFYLEATFRVNACSGNDRYGLVFRAPDTSQGYFYGVTCDGRFGLIRWDSMSQLIEWKPAEPLKAGPNQSNRVGVMARGDELTLYINGKEVSKINNSRYNEGLFGFFIASFSTPSFNVLVDDIAYWNQ